MNISNNTSITDSKAVGNFSKLTYWINEAIREGNNIEVEFTINDEWVSSAIKYTELRTFIVCAGLNEYCFDYSIAGEHVQDAGSFNVDAFLAENLNDAVRAYLEAKGAVSAAERMAA